MSSPDTIIAAQLSRLVGLPDAPVLLDVRTGEDYAADPRLLPASFRHDHRTSSAWAAEYAGRTVVIICQRGLKLSQGVAAWLRHAGASAEECAWVGITARQDETGQPFQGGRPAS